MANFFFKSFKHVRILPEFYRPSQFCFPTCTIIKLVSSLSFPIYSLLRDCAQVLRRFQHCTGHTTVGSWKGRGNQYIQLVRVLYCKLPTNEKQLPVFPLEAVPGTEPRPQTWETRVLPLCHCEKD